MAHDSSRLYNPCLLPWLETFLYFSVWICHSGYAVYAVFLTSLQEETSFWRGSLNPGFLPSGFPSKQDVTDYEWIEWKHAFWAHLPFYFGHLVIFNLISRKIGSERVFKRICLCFWIFANICIHGFRVVLFSLFSAFFGLFLATFSRSKILIWTFASILLVLPMFSITNFRIVLYADQNRTFIDDAFLSYNVLHIISALLCFIDEKSLDFQHFWNRFFDMLFYAFYMPYSQALLVTYADFRNQFATRHNYKDFLKILLFGARIVFWLCFFDFARHFLYFSAIFNHNEIMQRLSLPQLASVAYLLGQFFQVKYVVIFGISAFLAKIDGFQPPAMPLCISRVALYSNVWRYFDRGLYAFLKHHIYVPIAKPVFTPLRKILAAILCFAFVAIWHWANVYILIWIGLNFAELSLEFLGSWLWAQPKIRVFLERNFSETWLRRFVAFLMMPCTMCGVFSIFFFLEGGIITGQIIFERLVLNEIVKFTLPGLWAWLLCYAYCQVCIDLSIDFPFANNRGKVCKNM